MICPECKHDAGEHSVVGCRFSEYQTAGWTHCDCKVAAKELFALLEEELKKRKELEQKTEKPKQLVSQDFSKLKEICQDYIDDLANKGYVDEDHPYDIFETAMNCIFGSDVWQWVNRRL